VIALLLVASGGLLCMCAGACVCVTLTQTLSDGGMEGTSTRRWKTAVQFHTSSHSQSTYTPLTCSLCSYNLHRHPAATSISVRTLCPLLLAEHTTLPFRQQPFRIFKCTPVTHTYTHTHTHTHTSTHTHGQ